MIVRTAADADVAALAELQDIDPDSLVAFAEWVAAHAQSHLPFVAEVDGRVVGAAWLLVAERVPNGRRAVGFYLRTGFEHHRQLLLWAPDLP